MMPLDGVFVDGALLDGVSIVHQPAQVAILYTHKFVSFLYLFYFYSRKMTMEIKKKWKHLYRLMTFTCIIMQRYSYSRLGLFFFLQPILQSIFFLISPRD